MEKKYILLKVKIYWITECTTTVYFFPLFSFPSEEKEGRRKGQVISKTGSKQVFVSDSFNFYSKIRFC